MILPADLDPRSYLGVDALSYSELSTLAKCEKNWQLKYNDHIEIESTSEAMERGTELHRLLGMWWGCEAPEFLDTEDETAAWLMDRYDQHYTAEAAPLIMKAINIPFAVPLPGGSYLFGWFDGLVYNYETKEYWIVEFKTMGSWSRMHQLPVDKQITLYIWAANQMGLNVKGVMFDALLTTHWKTEEGEVYKSGPRKGEPKDYHPPADSFRREWVTRTDEEIQECLDEVKSACHVRTRLSFKLRAPIRNVGQHCGYCDYMPECYGISLELVDTADSAW